MKVRFKNRIISSESDIDILINDLKKVTELTVQMKDDYVKGDMLVSALCNSTDEEEVECLIPDTSLL